MLKLLPIFFYQAIIVKEEIRPVTHYVRKVITVREIRPMVQNVPLECILKKEDQKVRTFNFQAAALNRRP